MLDMDSVTLWHRRKQYGIYDSVYLSEPFHFAMSGNAIP